MCSLTDRKLVVHTMGPSFVWVVRCGDKELGTYFEEWSTNTMDELARVSWDFERGDARTVRGSDLP